VTCNSGVKFSITSISDNNSDPGTYSTVNTVQADIWDAANTTATSSIAYATISPNSSTPALNSGTSIAQTGPINAKNYRVDLFLGNTGFNPPLLAKGTYKVRVAIQLTPQ